MVNLTLVIYVTCTVNKATDLHSYFFLWSIESCLKCSRTTRTTLGFALCNLWQPGTNQAHANKDTHKNTHTLFCCIYENLSLSCTQTFEADMRPLQTDNTSYPITFICLSFERSPLVTEMRELKSRVWWSLSRQQSSIASAGRGKNIFRIVYPLKGRSFPSYLSKWFPPFPPTDTHYHCLYCQ